MKIFILINKKLFVTIGTILLTLLISSTTHAAVTLFPDAVSGQPVGTTILWTATTERLRAYDYRLTIWRQGDQPRVVYDYRALRFFEWTPIEDGTYNVVVSARNRVTGAISLAGDTFTIASRVTNAPMVTATSHPLVALYSAPPCQAGHQMRISFVTVSRRNSFSTPYKTCDGTHSMNFYLGGMLADSFNLVRSELRNGNDVLVSYGPLLSHRAGSLPGGLADIVPSLLGDLQTSWSDGVILLSPLPSSPGFPVPVATDLVGRVLWYYDDPLVPGSQVWRPIEGGTFLVSYTVFDLNGQGLREIDLAGNVVRDTTARRVSEQLVQAGHDPLTSIHHEAIRLANGHTAVLGSVERLLNDVQGANGVVDVIGDYVVVLDENWQVTWLWNSFDHLDIERAAIFDWKCGNLPSNNAGCPPVFLVDGDTTLANDWTHANSVTYSPADGNLIVSLRHQDWTLKIDYRDGNGNGEILWRLGADGDFAISHPDDFPWFSHQHDASYIDDNRIIIYDNGNTRCDGADGYCPSRGQVYRLNESTMNATLEVNADLGVYSLALGSAQLLSNGNLHFNSGLLFGPTANISQSSEVLPSGELNLILDVSMPVYRSFRMSDLYGQ